jgi:hypothetical protein
MGFEALEEVLIDDSFEGEGLGVEEQEGARGHILGSIEREVGKSGMGMGMGKVDRRVGMKVVRGGEWGHYFWGGILVVEDW